MNKSFTLALVFLLLTNASFAVSFNDIPDNFANQKSVFWMSNNNIIEGYSDGTFKPDQCVNRAEIIKILFETLEIKTLNNDFIPLFTDTFENEWHTPYIRTARDLGSVNGYADGTFKPSQCVNRAEAVKMTLDTFSQKTVIKKFYTPLPFADIETSSWYSDYISTVINSNLIDISHIQYSNETKELLFLPDQAMTRKEIAEMIYRIKAAIDNNLDYYTSDLTPKNLGENQKLTSSKKSNNSNSSRNSSSNRSGSSNNSSSQTFSEPKPNEGIATSYSSLTSHLFIQDYCYSWLSICFSVPNEYYVFDYYDESKPYKSEIIIASVRNGDELDYLNLSQYTTINYAHQLNSSPRYSDLEDLENEVEDGYFLTLKITNNLESIFIDDLEFKKLKVQGFNGQDYTYYFFEHFNKLYQFKVKSTEEYAIINLIGTIKFTN